MTIDRMLIIEDEKPNADRLRRLIKTLRPATEILTVLESIADAVAWFEANDEPDVVMMDVRLSDGLSFEIFERVKVTCPVIFTTAFDEYAVRAFKFNSIDYLLKPIEPDELSAAFDKLERTNIGNNTVSLDGLVNFLQSKDYRNRFLLPYKDGYKTVLVSDIMFFYVELKVTRARLVNGGDEIVPQTMEELEQQLNPKTFFRVNRQYIVFIDAIQQVHNFFNGKLKVDIRNSPDVEIIVSRDKANQLKSWLDY